MEERKPISDTVRETLQYFKYDHLPERLQAVSESCATLAYQMAHELPDGSQLWTGLRKLLEAKDCFVRAELGRKP